jgi:ion channel-forming bestrophin family protein
LLSALLATLVYVFYHILHFEQVGLPVAPVSIIGVGLAIFLGFRNSSAYDRWWEARKIWGGIVNYSRTWGMEVTSFIQPVDRLAAPEVNEAKRILIYRHIAWLYAMAMHLRKQMKLETLAPFLNSRDAELVKEFKNIPSQLFNLQSNHVEEIFQKDALNEFKHLELNRKLEEFYNLQGKAERIKNTVFPYYYNYFTRVFLRLFLVILPFALVDEMGWESIPLSVAISFVFEILDKSGTITEEPFEGRAADTPMTALCRTIEIDLRQMLGENELPEPIKPRMTKFGAAFLE